MPFVIVAVSVQTLDQWLSTAALELDAPGPSALLMLSLPRLVSIDSSIRTCYMDMYSRTV